METISVPKTVDLQSVFSKHAAADVHSRFVGYEVIRYPNTSDGSAAFATTLGSRRDRVSSMIIRVR